MYDATGIQSTDFFSDTQPAMPGFSRATLSLDEYAAALPARCVLDCVFALTPDGRILHFHLGQLQAEATADGPCYRFVDPDGAPDRRRCRVIPPLVPVFRR